LFEHFVQKNYPQFGKKWETFGDGKIFQSAMCGLGALERWKQNYGNNSNMMHSFFSSPDCNDIMIKHNKVLLDLFTELADSHSQYVLTDRFLSVAVMTTAM